VGLAVLQQVERGDVEALRRASELARPVTLAGERSLPVLDALEPLLPEGIRRGATVTVDGGAGSTSLALALGAAASQAGSWSAIVGAPSLGLLAATELGLAPERLLVVADPPASSLATVVAALLDSVDVVYVRGGEIAASDARRQLARARERESVLVPLPGVQGGGPRSHGWALTADVRLSVASPEWHWNGRLVARRVHVTASGKGVYARERRASLWLPDETGAVALAD
jgi:hypothetical protein